MMSRSMIHVIIHHVISYSLDKKQWETDNFIPYERDGIMIEAPKRRMHHAADVYGCMLVVNGGISAESKQILNDFTIYDISKVF